MSKAVCIARGRIVDPTLGLDAVGELYLSQGRVAAIRAEGYAVGELPAGESDRIEAPGALVLPGLIDLHVHFRDPGLTYKEDMESGCAAAAAGGFTTVCMMPNTKPVLDTAEAVAALCARAEGINALPIGAITMGQQGRALTDAAALKRAGACALSEDGRSVADASVMLEAMRAAAEAGLPIFDHTEDDALPGTAAGEACMAARDLVLARESGAALHLCHISAKLSLDCIRAAKAAGYSVTAETAPHYFTFDETCAADGNFKMNPPLRTAEDVAAVIRAIQDGTLDAIATDHAPHSAEEKQCGYGRALNGVIGLETSFPVSYTGLVRAGHIPLSRLVALMSANPARILGDPKRGTLAVGAYADVAVFDVERPYRIDPESFRSKGRSTPFAGMEVCGKTLLTVAGGRIVYRNME